MAQTDIWENEYRDPKLVSNSNEPQLDFKHFVKWLRKSEKIDLDGLRVLDLGSGTGKNAIFLAERGSIVTGIEISATAIRLAEQRTEEAGIKIDYLKISMGNPLPFEAGSFDLILDVVSSNSLNDQERIVYLSEVSRVLKTGGHIFIKALCKDGDKHAQKLMERFPGFEHHTYVMPETNITERVFTKDEISNLYSGLTIKVLERKSSYTQFRDKSYKRNFWLVYLQKDE